jgi:Fe-S-cluster containining protein
MDASLCHALSQVCSECRLAGECCFEARPPLTKERIGMLLANGIAGENIEYGKYNRLKLKPDGFCVLFQNGKCKVHSVKPETCVAGPFTFDMKGTILEIYLKKESICPLAGFLRENKEAYDGLFEAAVAEIVDLVTMLPVGELAEVLKIEEPDTELVAEIKLRDPRFSS